MTTSPRYAVTGASGELGRRIVAALARRVDPGAIVAVVRDPVRAAGRLPEGVVLRSGDYDRPETLRSALDGVERVLLISSNDLGRRVDQHRAVIDAAVEAGAARLFYTSVLHADVSRLGLAKEHRLTEDLIEACGLAHTLLRNGWYTENHAASIPAALTHGALIGSAGAGRISAASRQDYAEAAVAALLADDPARRTVHELAGDAAFDLSGFAAELSRQSGRTIPYVDLPQAEYRQALIGAGLPEPLAELLADSDAAAAGGALFDDGGALSRLIGRPTTPLAETVAEALKA